MYDETDGDVEKFTTLIKRVTVTNFFICTLSGICGYLTFVNDLEEFKFGNILISDYGNDNTVINIVTHSHKTTSHGACCWVCNDLANYQSIPMIDRVDIIIYMCDLVVLAPREHQALAGLCT
jgi:hypothetical protein